MKVDFTRSPVTYQKQNVQPQKPTQKKAEAKTDTFELSRNYTDMLSSRAEWSVSSIKSEIHPPASSARLENLRTMVTDGTYSISTENLVNAILK